MLQARGGKSLSSDTKCCGVPETLAPKIVLGHGDKLKPTRMNYNHITIDAILNPPPHSVQGTKKNEMYKNSPVPRS